jgi:hypothetical protein
MRSKVWEDDSTKGDARKHETSVETPASFTLGLSRLGSDTPDTNVLLE